MPDPAELSDVEQIRAEMRAELAEVRADAALRLLILAMTPYLPSNGHRLPPLFERRRVSIPAPRVTPEGARHDRPARAARRRR